MPGAARATTRCASHASCRATGDHPVSTFEVLALCGNSRCCEDPSAACRRLVSARVLALRSNSRRLIRTHRSAQQVERNHRLLRAALLRKRCDDSYSPPALLACVYLMADAKMLPGDNVCPFGNGPAADVRVANVHERSLFRVRTHR